MRSLIAGFLLAMAFFQTVNSAVSAEPNLLAMPGEYHGVIWSAGTNLPSTTTFFLEKSGRVTGEYRFLERDGKETIGTLQPCVAINVRRITCQWNDLYGMGSLEMLFSTGFTSFRGQWRALGEEGRGRKWTGRKELTT